MELATIVIGALVQLAAEYGVVQPLSNVARNIIHDKRRKAAFTQAITAAYADLEVSEYAELTAVLLDDFFLRQKAVIQELLKAVLVATRVDYDHLQAVYVASGLGKDSPDIRPALCFLVEQIRKHAADRDEWFREYYSLLLQEREIALAEQQVALQTRIVRILEQLNRVQPDKDQVRRRGVSVPGARCRIVWGRDHLVKEVLNRLNNPKETSILSLSGGPGYGKTEVARQVAEQALVQDLFADVLWVTARRTELVAGHVSPKQRSGDLTGSGFLDELAAKLACPVGQVRRCLREEKLLVILDNAETADLKAILPELVDMLNPSRALLTSRLETQTPYVGLIPIQGLEERWSHGLLRDEAAYNNIPVLMQASDEDLHRVHELSCGAPLALHFVVGRVLHDYALEPVLSELKQASQQVAEFYRFCLEAAWQRISGVAKDVLRYMGHIAETSVTWTELSGSWNLPDSELRAALADLRQWYLVEAVPDAQGNIRYDLHPWVRHSVRGRLVDDWQLSAQDVERIAKWKMDQITKWKHSQG